MASASFGIKMEKKALNRLWLMDTTGFTKFCHAFQREQTHEERCDDNKSEHESTTKTEDKANIPEKDLHENGYFSIWPDKDESEDSEESEDGESENGEPSEEEDGKEEEEESDDEAEVLAFSEMKRLSSKWMKSLLPNIDGKNKWDNDKDDEALKIFQETVEIDPNNINALKHCRYVLRKMKRQTEADEVSRKIQEKFASASGRLIQARSEAELGMVIKALTWMGKLGSVTGQLVHAIELAADEVHPAEREFWRLNLAEAFHWWYLCRWQQGIPGNLEMLEKSIELFCQVAVSNDSDAVTKAQALNQLGDFCSRKDAHFPPILNKAITKANIFRGSINPQDFYHKAYSLDPDSVTIGIEYGTFLMRKRKLDEAKNMIDKAFAALDPKTKYYHAYAMRGELYTKLYNRDKHKAHLERAIKALLYFTEHVHQSYGFGMLGTAYYLLTMHDNPIYLEKEDMRPALQAYEAAIYKLGYRRNPLSHFHHAECLADFGYLRRAVESSKRAIEHDLAGKNNTHIILDFMKQLLQLYEDEKKPDYIMSECVFWMDLICHKYATCLLRTLLRDLYEIHRTAITRLYHNLLFNKHEETARLFPKLIPNFRPWCPHPPKGYIPPPPPSVPYNILKKPFDFLLLHSEPDRPWVHCSFLTKFELLYKLKGCVIGRDIEGDPQSEDMLAKVVSTMISVQTTETAALSTKGDGDEEEKVKRPHSEKTSNDETTSAVPKRLPESSTPNSNQTNKTEADIKKSEPMKADQVKEKTKTDTLPTGVQNQANKTKVDGTESKPMEADVKEKKKSNTLWSKTPSNLIEDDKPVYVHLRRLNFRDTPEHSACLIIVLTEAFVHSAWFEDSEDGEERRPHPKLQDLLDTHKYIVVLRWENAVRYTRLLRTRHTALEVYDCSNLVHWNKIAISVQQHAGHFTTRVLSRGSKIPITDPFLA